MTAVRHLLLLLVVRCGKILSKNLKQDLKKAEPYKP